MRSSSADEAIRLIPHRAAEPRTSHRIHRRRRIRGNHAQIHPPAQKSSASQQAPAPLAGNSRQPGSRRLNICAGRGPNRGSWSYAGKRHHSNENYQGMSRRGTWPSVNSARPCPPPTATRVPLPAPTSAQYPAYRSSPDLFPQAHPDQPRKTQRANPAHPATHHACRPASSLPRRAPSTTRPSAIPASGSQKTTPSDSHRACAVPRHPARDQFRSPDQPANFANKSRTRATITLVFRILQHDRRRPARHPRHRLPVRNFRPCHSS